MRVARNLNQQVTAISGAVATAAAATLLGFLAAGSAHAGAPDRTLWWNDPVIVEQVGLSEGQRSKMDAAYASYSERASSGRRTRDVKNDFLAALEKGDWKDARTQLDLWTSQESNPQHAMAEMKLEILQLLSADQRNTLMESYPRILRRPWRPVLSWDRTAGQGNAKSFKRAIREQPQQKSKQPKKKD